MDVRYSILEAGGAALRTGLALAPDLRSQSGVVWQPSQRRDESPRVDLPLLTARHHAWERPNPRCARVIWCS